MDRYNTLLAILTALTIVLGMRMMGAMLISSLVIFPALTAMRLVQELPGVVVCAGITSVVCFCVGLTVSFVVHPGGCLGGGRQSGAVSALLRPAPSAAGEPKSSWTPAGLFGFRRPFLSTVL